MNTPPALPLFLSCIALGCGASQDQPAVDIAGEERYEECKKDEADIRLDVKVSRADEPKRVATIPFHLRRVNYLGFNESGGQSRYKDGCDSEGNAWYTQIHMDLADITRRDARFQLSYLRAEVGKPPSVDVRIDVLVSLTEEARRELEGGIIVESSVTQLRAEEQQNKAMNPSGNGGWVLE